MAIGFVKQCFEGVPGVPGEHVHAPEIRVFEDLDDLPAAIRALQSEFIRVVSAAGPGGAITVVRQDDGKFGCRYWVAGDVTTDTTLDSLTDVEHWIKGYFPSTQNELPVYAAGGDNATLQ